MKFYRHYRSILFLPMALPAVIVLSAGWFSGDPVVTFLIQMESHSWLKWMLHPAILIGGPLLVFAVAAFNLFRVSADYYDQSLVLGIRMGVDWRDLVPLAISGLSLAVLGAFFIAYTVMGVFGYLD